MRKRGSKNGNRRKSRCCNGLAPITVLEVNGYFEWP
jgi:hypothetical protein